MTVIPAKVTTMAVQTRRVARSPKKLRPTRATITGEAPTMTTVFETEVRVTAVM